MSNVVKCNWSLKTELEEKYHDEEWGVPILDDTKLFELLSLELCQSGLSWHTILKKREGFIKAFDGFDIVRVSKFSEKKTEKLLTNEEIVRHRAKITAIINNASRVLEIQKEFGAFSNYLWGFVDHKPVVGGWDEESEIPSSTELSDKISKDLKSRGFKFLGTTTTYAFLQSVGVVNDHIKTCFRFNQCNQL